MESASWLVVGIATRRCRSAKKSPSSKYFSARPMAPSRVPVIGFLAWLGRKIASFLRTARVPRSERRRERNHGAERAHRFHQDGRGRVRQAGGRHGGRAGEARR